METKRAAPDAVAKNIKALIADHDTTKNALAVSAGIPSTSFFRKLDQKPETFNLEELGSIAEVFGLHLEDLVKGVA